MGNQQNNSVRAAVFLAPGAIELQSFPRPELKPGEAFVQIECCTVCGSDLHTYSGARREAAPSILGHEIVGRVVEITDPPLADVNGNALNVGDRVTWSTAVSCGACDRCLRGFPQKCRSVAKYGHEVAEGRMALSGGLADGILLRPGTACIQLDDHIPHEVICPVNCATATIAAAYRVAGEIADRRVLILGTGMLGLTAVAFARVGGARQIVACDVNAARLERAGSFGADDTVHWADSAPLGEDDFDVVLELSGAPAAVEASIASVDVGGHVALVGSVMPTDPVAVTPERVVRGWQTIHGVHNYTPKDLATAVSFLTTHGANFPFAQLVERAFPLQDVRQAIDFAHRERPIRIAVLPQQ